MRVLGAVLVVLGLLALVYGGFWYETEEHEVDLGPLDLKVERKRRVNVPVWAGVGAVAVGAVVLATSRRRAA